jgi:hypothetical protein
MAVFVRSTSGQVGRSCTGKLSSQGKSFDVSCWELWEAFQQVNWRLGRPGRHLFQQRHPRLRRERRKG